MYARIYKKCSGAFLALIVQSIRYTDLCRVCSTSGVCISSSPTCLQGSRNPVIFGSPSTQDVMCTNTVERWTQWSPHAFRQCRRTQSLGDVEPLGVACKDPAPVTRQSPNRSYSYGSYSIERLASISLYIKVSKNAVLCR